MFTLTRANGEFLEVKMNGAKTTNECNCFVSYVDEATATIPQTVRSATKTTNGASDVVLVAAPTEIPSRKIETIVVYNADTVSQVLTLKITSGGTEFKIYSGTLTTLQTLRYTPETGFTVF